MLPGRDLPGLHHKVRTDTKQKVPKMPDMYRTKWSDERRRGVQTMTALASGAGPTPPTLHGAGGSAMRDPGVFAHEPVHIQSTSTAGLTGPRRDLSGRIRRQRTVTDGAPPRPSRASTQWGQGRTHADRSNEFSRLAAGNHQTPTSRGSAHQITWIRPSTLAHPNPYGGRGSGQSTLLAVRSGPPVGCRRIHVH